jgi:hypothetical protein
VAPLHNRFTVEIDDRFAERVNHPIASDAHKARSQQPLRTVAGTEPLDVDSLSVEQFSERSMTSQNAQGFETLLVGEIWPGALVDIVRNDRATRNGDLVYNAAIAITDTNRDQPGWTSVRRGRLLDSQLRWEDREPLLRSRSRGHDRS